MGSTKTAVVIRHAGYGDAIQASCVLPYLKEDGYTVTMYANERVAEILSNNPHIDHWKHFEDNSVPLVALPDHYDEVCAQYDKGVVLTGIIEQRLLFGPGQEEWYQDDAARRKQAGGKNYYDAHIEAAGYSGGSPNGELYFNRAERRRGKAWRDKLKKKKQIIIGWALAGSSVHKAYRYTEEVIRAFAKVYPNVKFIFFGDYVTKLLTFPHANVDNTFIVSEPSFRDSLLYTSMCDIVIGPETGIVMGAGCFSNIYKILLASHSSPDQIIKYWDNAMALLPPCKSCHPCHRLFKFVGLHQEVCELEDLHSDDVDNPIVKAPKCCFTEPGKVLEALEWAYIEVVDREQ